MIVLRGGNVNSKQKNTNKTLTRLERQNAKEKIENKKRPTESCKQQDLLRSVSAIQRAFFLISQLIRYKEMAEYDPEHRAGDA